MVHQHEDSSLTARVWVDGRLLRPDCVACTRAAMQSYVEGALVDVRREDRLVLRVQGVGGIRPLSTQDVALAMRWLSEQLPVTARDEAQSEGARSGTRRIVRPRATSKDATEPKAS